MRARIIIPILLFMIAAAAHATIFGGVRGTLHDAGGAAVANERVTLTSESSDWTRSTETDAHGSFAFPAVPLGSYRLTPGNRILHVESAATVELSLLIEQITIVSESPRVDPRSPATRSTIARHDIAETPGAERSNSLAMITAFVPGATIVHDQLHIRGGHQVSWLIDGVPVPNTNIASNAGPQFDPKDVDYLEVQRGGYSAEYGDRTYAVFNVVPRTGFESNREAGLVLGFGSWQSIESQIRFGDHSDRFAYYASINANRSDLGLETPIPRVIHDRSSGISGLTTLNWQPSSTDQVRVAAAVRGDDYQIPSDEEGDRQRERDAFANLTWARVIDSSSLLTISPFFHQNRAGFEGGPDDPIVTTDRHRSSYLGAQAACAGRFARNDVRIGAFGFLQRDNFEFALRANDGSGTSLSQIDRRDGSIEAVFVEGQRDVTSSVTLRGGVRVTHFSGGVRETVASPRAGLVVRLPWLGAVARASYGLYYQAPPLTTVSGPLLDLAVKQGFGFLPLHGERDRASEIGLAVPAGGWTIDTSAFRTEARNFFDHDALGNSNIFLPLTIDRAHIRGFETTISSPRMHNVLQAHLAYSHQIAQGEGAVAGGLTDFAPPEEGRFALDHD
ncbi:MAG: TonB-dependent receptor, partial [Thermoanaerobaculia bacterium]